jgi:hypothetical protein
LASFFAKLKKYVWEKKIFLMKFPYPGTSSVCLACPRADANEFTLASDYKFLFGQHFCEKNCCKILKTPKSFEQF